MLTAIIIAAAVAALIVFFFLCYKKAPPTQAIVVTGLGLSRPKVVCGRGVFVLPIVQRADRLNMRLLKIDVKTPETGVKTKEGVSLWLDSVVTVQVYSENSTVSDDEVRAAGYDDIKKYINSRQQSAISNFLGMDEAHINEKINDVLQGNLREIVSEMTVDQILTNRKQMAVSVVENARPDLAKMGLEVVTFNVQDVKDAVDAMGHNHGVIEAIGVEQEELVKKRASIAKAEAERDVSCAKAAAAMAANEKEIEAQTAIAKRNNELELAKSQLKAEADKAAADALFAAGKNAINEPEVLDCGKYAGMTTLEARKAILADLKEGGFLKEIEPLKHEVGTCYRCHSTIEPMISKQWFVKMEPLAKPAIESVEKGEIKFVPERFTKNYMNWMKNTRDWCISRQLWWGHQIPAWYCDDCGETVVAKSAPCTCPKCGSAKLTRDPDTLDTWFSSALWPFSTLGWPNEDSADLKYFYPTNTLVTGYDIIGFWVSRMIFSGLAYTGKAPFDTVCIHGIVRDSQGRKMSKSLGNGIDPLEVIAQYGADALRFMLVDGSTPGNDMRYIEKKVEAARNFANKLWNATRFVLMNLPEDFEPGLPCEELLDMSDKWVLTKLNQVAGAMTDNLEHYEMGLAAAKINSFIWDVYCDWFIEIAKPRLNSGDAQQADTARRVLVYVLDKALKLLHPFMPFITEELYQALPGSAETIMTQAWPTFDAAHNWAAEEEAFEKVMDYIKAVRTMRTEMNVHPAKKTSMIIETADAAPFQNAQVYLAKFAFATDVTFTEKYEGSTDGMVQVSTHAARGFIPMMELIDREKELARLNKEKAKAEKEMAMFGNQLNNPKFVERAPAALVEEIRTKFAKSQDKLANIEQSIKALG